MSKKKLQMLGLAAVMLATSAKLPGLPLGGIIVFDPTSYEEAILQGISLIKTYNTVKSTLDNAIYQARTLGNLGRYRTHTSVWQRVQRLPGGSVDPRVQVWIDAVNTGVNAAGSYSHMTYGAVTPYANMDAFSADVRRRKSVDVATIEALDATGSIALDTVGQARNNGPENEQMIRELVFDATHDNVDNYTEAKNAQRLNLFAAVNSKMANDTQKLVMATMEIQLLRMKQERDAAAYALANDVEFRRAGHQAIKDQIGDPSATLMSFRMR